VPFQFNGFDSGSPVTISIWSNRVDLGNVIADSAGVVSGAVTLPAALKAGVHMLEFRGTTNASTRTVQVLVRVAGRAPGGTDQGLYFSGFGGESAVQVSYGGLNWSTVTPDASGGFFIDLPFPVPTVPAAIDVVATGLTTGRIVTQAIFPAPFNAAVWATGGDSGALTVSGSGIRIDGWAHSDGGVIVQGPGTRLSGGLEYATTARVTGRGVRVAPAPVQVSPGGEPLTVNVADWRPGGLLATHLGPQYSAIDPFACLSGTWHPAPNDIRGMVVYVPCGVELSVSGPINSSIIAEGAITVSGAGVHLTNSSLGFSLASGSSAAAALNVTASGFQAAGALWTAGGANLSGEGSKLACGLYASTISITGSGTDIGACAGA
jgi:hypothetical protein